MSVKFLYPLPARLAVFAVLSMLALSAVSGCSKSERNMPHIILPLNFALGWYPHYLIVKEPYLRIFSQKNTSSPVLDFARRGDAAEILEISGHDEDGFIWYHIQTIGNNERTDELSPASGNSSSAYNTQGWILSRGAARTAIMEQALFLSKKEQARRR